jgi:hypothetical protein
MNITISIATTRLKQWNLEELKRGCERTVQEREQNENRRTIFQAPKLVKNYCKILCKMPRMPVGALSANTR